jgi:hypothetical protein
MTKPTFVSRLVLGLALSTFLFVACNNEKKDEKKSESTEQKMEPKKDTIKTGDTGNTKPVSPGN